MILCTILSLGIANSYYGPAYNHIWHLKIGSDFLGLHLTIEHWINDGLMVFFFLLVGLEIKREIIEGELSGIKKAMLPIVAAIGGIIIPAIIFTSFNFNTPHASGWGIPMATDIAFALSVLALLGNRVPLGLKVMLTALAIVDDLGAIIVIALFYSKEISIIYLLLATAVVAVLFLLNRFKVEITFIYILLGIILWYLILKSGIHATIAGVILAMFLPLGKGEEVSVAEKLEHHLDYPVAFLVIPLFALCNTGFAMNMQISDVITSSLGIGIIAGLFVGKPLGIFTFSFIAIKTGLASLPSKSSWIQLLGIGFLGGIGFTMSIFITLLAFDDFQIQSYSKVAILTGSMISGVIGYLFLIGNKK